MKSLMTRARTLLCAFFVLGLVSGCANIDSIHHQFEYDAETRTEPATATEKAVTTDQKVRAISVDANQRFLTNIYGFDREKIAAWRACAEASPDGLAVFGGAIAGSAGKSEANAQLAAGVAAQAASIGLRTQSITLLRDAQYRLCEAYVNGALTGSQLATLQRRFQNIMVANLAIEQLTGYAKPTIVTVGAGSSATVAGGLAQAQKALDDAQKDVTKKQADDADAKKKADDAAADYTAKKNDAAKIRSELPPLAADTAKKYAAAADAAKKARDAANQADAVVSIAKSPTAAQLKTKADADKAATTAEATAASLKADSDKLNKTADDADEVAAKAKTASDTAATAKTAADKALSDAQANVKALQDQVDAARGLTASASPAAPGTVTLPAPSPAASEAVANAVVQIVDKVLTANYTTDDCLDYLINTPSNKLNNTAALLCYARMAAGPGAKSPEDFDAKVRSFAPALQQSLH
jgi:chemotaxis protein histidine kinase CheA